MEANKNPIMDYKEIKITIGRLVKSRRQEIGFSIEKLANHSGLSQAMIRLIENGKCSPTILSLHKISSALRTNIKDLIPNSEDIPFLFVEKKNRVSYNSGNTKIIEISIKKDMHIFELILKPGRYDKLNWISGFKSYTFLVPTGSLTLHLQKEKFLLNKGDMIQFKGFHLETIENTSKEEVSILIIGFFDKEKF